MAMEKRSKLDKFLARLPYYFSCVILITTWMLFMLFISLGEILIRRREIGRFLEQVVIYHFLLGMTLLSLITTARRGPGSPDQTLAPIIPNKQRRRPADLAIRPRKEVKAKAESSIPNGPVHALSPCQEQADVMGGDDDVPLRFLRNAQWVNSRIGKDRPSPLPLPNMRRYPPLPPSAAASSSEFSSTRSGQLKDGTATSSPESNRTSEFETGSESEYSPFPLSAFSASAKSPFVPSTAQDAGEDDDELAQEETIDRSAEKGPLIRSSDVDGLLSSRNDRNRSEVRSLMAKSNTGEARWCKKCEGWKPDRCHHCRHCQQCVLKMDHHCPWVGTCVGFHNYKPFFLFINYATLLALYATLEAGYETFRFFQDPDAAVLHSQIVQLEGNANGTITSAQNSVTSGETWSDGLALSPAVFMMLFVVGGFMTLAVGSLAIFHWYLSTHNQTTLENITHSYPSALLDAPPKGQTWKADHLLTRSERFRLREEAREINVYDLGWKRNLRDLMIGGEGTRVGKWAWIKAFFPVGRPNRFDRRAGYFFAYDAEKLDRLRELTAELRYGVKRHRADGTETERKTRSSHDSTYSDQGHDYDDDGEDDEALNGSGDDGQEEKLLGGNTRWSNNVDRSEAGKGMRRSRVSWFEV